MKFVDTHNYYYYYYYFKIISSAKKKKKKKLSQTFPLKEKKKKKTQTPKYIFSNIDSKVCILFVWYIFPQRKLREFSDINVY